MIMAGGPSIPEAFSDFLVFVDESGYHSLTSVNPDYPIFVLAFCLVPRKAYVDDITPAVRRLKCDFIRPRLGQTSLMKLTAWRGLSQAM